MDRMQNISELKTMIEEKIAKYQALIEEDPGDIESYIYLGDAYHLIGRFTLALKYYEEAEKLAKNSAEKSKRYLPAIFYRVGLVLTDMHKYREALSYLVEGLRMAREEDRRELIDLILIAMAEIFGDLDMFVEKGTISKDFSGRDDYEAHLPIISDIPPYMRFGPADYQKAIHYFEEALKRAEERNKSFNSFVAKSKLGNLYMRIGDYENAEKYLIEASSDARNMNINIVKQENMPNCYIIEINGKKFSKLCV